VINGNQVVAWVLGMVAWVLICSGAWFAASRADYAKLAQARVCYDENGHSRSTFFQSHYSTNRKLTARHGFRG